MLVRPRLVAVIPVAGVLVAGALLAPVLSAGCQTSCSSNAQCASGSYCQFVDGECLTTTPLSGSCQPIPAAAACADLAATVCGCDGWVYQSACAAAHAGVSVVSSGYCNPVSCDSAHGCPVEQCCQYDAGACGATMAAGVGPGICLTPDGGAGH